jgi:hypothetical protein
VRRVASEGAAQVLHGDENEMVPFPTLGRPLVSPGFAGCQGAGQSGPAHGAPALLALGHAGRLSGGVSPTMRNGLRRSLMIALRTW